jgi:SAM-dependent methyltransferase
LREHGYSPRSLGWGAHGKQDVRFLALTEPVLHHPQASVLDVGCGFADLYDFLVGQGWRGDYTGVDIVSGLLTIARQRHPQLDLREMDITDCPLPPHSYDFVIASGTFNSKLEVGDNWGHTRAALTTMFSLARVAVCIDFLGTFVDFQAPGAWHTDPGWALSLAKELSKRVLLRYDYMPYEFSLTIFCDDELSKRGTFRAFEDTD